MSDEEENESKIDSDAWMGTLSDLVFLLITFFVLLISSASMDDKKLKEAFGFMNDAMSVLDFPSQSTGEDNIAEHLNPLVHFMASHGLVRHEKNLDDIDPGDNFRKTGMTGTSPDGDMLNTLRSISASSGGKIKIERTSDGLSVVMPGRILFPNNDTRLDKEGRGYLAEISTVLYLWGGDVEVAASWSWHQGPAIMATVISHMEKNKVDSESITPRISRDAEQTIRFILRQRNE